MLRRNLLIGLAATLLSPKIVFGNGLPRRVEWDASIHKWSMYGNDIFGDCVVASCAQAIAIWTKAHGNMYVVPTQKVKRFWMRLSGYIEGVGLTTEIGTRIADALNAWQKDGWDIGLAERNYLVDYAGIAPDRKSLRIAIHNFGGCMMEFEAPVSEVMLNQSSWCKLSKTKHTDDELSRHAVFAVGYDDDYECCDGSIGGIVCISWGGPHMVSWKFVEKYAVTAAILLSKDWTGPSGVAPNGLTHADLQAQINRVKAQIPN